MGSVLHFPKPNLEDYYILSPQWWFDSCALVISPSNVNELIAAGDGKNNKKYMYMYIHYGHAFAVTIIIISFFIIFSRAWFWFVEVPDDAGYVFGEEGLLGASSPHI